MILAIDAGTTGVTCLVIAGDGTIRGRANSEFAQYFPVPGWVEHDAQEIWETAIGVIHQAIANAGIKATDLDAIGITNQRETVVAWNSQTGEPVHNAIVWQDRRTTARCAQLRADGHEELVRHRTGLTLDPYFSATKIEWLRQNVDAARDGAVFGTIDSWLLFKLTGRHITDYTNASRTMLFDIERLQWDTELCDLFSVDPNTLPEPRPSCEIYGTTDPDLLGAAIPVSGMAGDQQAALFGQACLTPGLAKNTYGTGSFVLLNVGEMLPSPAEGLLTTVAAVPSESETSYALEASVFICGAAVQWLRDGLGLVASASETERLAASLDSNDGVYFVPALTGLGSPYWDPNARGAIFGLTRGTGRAQMVRAALEAMAYQTVDAVDAMQQAGELSLSELHADGGAVANGWLMQFQADMLGVPVVVPQITETTALGAGLLAGIATGVWSAADVDALWREDRRYEPAIEDAKRSELIGEWRNSVAATRERGLPTDGNSHDEDRTRLND